MNWRLKRQLIAIGIIGVLTAIIVFSLFFWFDVVTLSNDGVRQLKETPQSLRLIWSRFFFIRPGVYDVAAFLENPNEHAKADRVSYAFRLFDENDILIAAKEGIGFINPGERFVIVEPLVATGVRTPRRISFEIRDAIWKSGEKTVVPIVVKQKRFETSGIDTALHAILANSDVNPVVAELEIVSVLADGEGNATAVARALIDSLAAGEEREVIFTWPRVLPEPHAIQIYVRER